jgi:hypothetical protein
MCPQRFDISVCTILWFVQKKKTFILQLFIYTLFSIFLPLCISITFCPLDGVFKGFLCQELQPHKYRFLDFQKRVGSLGAVKETQTQAFHILIWRNMVEIHVQPKRRKIPINQFSIEFADLQSVYHFNESRMHKTFINFLSKIPVVKYI